MPHNFFGKYRLREQSVQGLELARQVCWTALLAASAMFCDRPAFASPVADVCDRAAALASRDRGVPLDVLRAITRTETGRRVGGALQPWPWTVNMEGVGRWFETEDEARAYVFANFKRGARSFDVGCFQINYKWHGTAFRSIDDMFDPVQNADYAARFLAELYGEFGDWRKAAGAYHSRTAKYAEIYTARFDRIRDRTEPMPAQTVVAGQTGAIFGPPRRIEIDAGLAGGPIIGRGAARLGSLVPLAGPGQAGSRALVRLE